MSVLGTFALLLLLLLLFVNWYSLMTLAVVRCFLLDCELGLLDAFKNGSLMYIGLLPSCLFASFVIIALLFYYMPIHTFIFIFIKCIGMRL